MRQADPKLVKEIRKRIAKAFREFRKRGGVAEMDCMCCCSCGSAKLGHVAEQAGKYKIAFFHKQARDLLRERGEVYIYYFVPRLAKIKYPQVEVGREMFDLLRLAGLKAQWTGETCSAITVDGLAST